MLMISSLLSTTYTAVSFNSCNFHMFVYLNPPIFSGGIEHFFSIYILTISEKGNSKNCYIFIGLIRIHEKFIANDLSHPLHMK